ncbi:MAG: opacity protein-like surface antigen [Flavobacteriales bacterium]|jgi:opacity protein-like surface antigen
MKKAIIIAAAALFCVTGTNVQAQKQIGGDKNIEFQFAPLGGSPISISGIRFRTFLDENSAFRVNLFIGSQTDKSVTSQEGELSIEDPTSPILYMYDRTFDLTIRPGYEIHFDGTDRLSPYVGAELDFGIGRMSTEQESWGANDIDNVGEPEQNVVWTQTDKDGFTRIGLNLLAGFDFYFSDSIYLGAEMGFGFSNTSMSDSTVEFSDVAAWSLAETGGGDATLEAPDAIVNGSTFNVGPTVNGLIRLGFLIN